MTEPAQLNRFRKTCFALMLAGMALPALADVPLAGPQADRQAKAAVPSASEALVYVYRKGGETAAPITVKVSGRDPSALGPGTFALWRVKPGRAEVTAEGTASKLALRADANRVYYIELSRSPAGGIALRQAPFPVGRPQVQRARLVARTVEAPPQRAAAPAARRHTGKAALTLKLGSFKLGEESQTIIAERRFDSSASSAFALEGEWFVRPHTSFGVELIRYSHDFVTPSIAADTGSVDTTAVLVNVKKYFLPGSSWQPYLGLGLGGVVTDLSGAVTGNTGGVALQLAGGAQWRADRFALRLEYKYLSADTEDDNGQKIDMSGSGAFLGAGFYF